ncbi:VOC family protein [Arthrobacter sp. CJ23]|uniref:VOC family protein n=1 Tax=Arthrobacter sp. CJ23 TaxID=2972479 RepID=UPI00215D19CD|nr:VOC family protein [Arthrobacter sp. CJ23]UVJ39076.1 VOC family protein [Arthrobacter sp. CJ23]
MPEVESYKQGTPCWVDLSSTDIEVSKNFYSGLFGWELDSMDAGQGMTYYMAKLQGRYVAGLMQQLPDAPAGMPSYWANYIAVDSVDEAAERAAAAGGTIVFPPDTVPNGGGRLFFAADPTGAQIGFWEAGTHHGSGLVNVPGTMAWNEVQTSDVPTAVAFYEAVTGCSSSTAPAGDVEEYTSLLVDGEPVAGVMKLPGEGLPPFWMTYFNVADVDAAVAQAVGLGSHVIAPAFDVPGIGRFAVLMDPAGAAFSIMKGVAT